MNAWKNKEGKIPLFDHPSLKIDMFRWTRRPDTQIEVIQRRIETGQISELDIDIAVTLANAKLLTEQQIRYLYRNVDKGHKIGTRLRVLQQNGWLEGWRLENQLEEREYVWSVGIAAKNFLGYMMGMQNIPNPVHFSSSIAEQLYYPAINEIRIRLLERGLLNKEKFELHPFIGAQMESPHAAFQLDTPVGKLEFLVERIQQRNKPLRFMKKKLSQYRSYYAEHGRLPSVYKDSQQSVLVWSIAVEEGIDLLVSSYSKFEQEFMQLFLVDECLDDLRKSWRLARPLEENQSEIKVFDMDFM
jgi:hypothetical protein